MASLLTGIDGRNPCGFLAALGALRLLTDYLEDEVRLTWTSGGAGALHPVLQLGEERDKDELCRLVLDAHEARDLIQELGWEVDVMRLPCERARDLLAPSSGRLISSRSVETVGACVADVPRRRRGQVNPDRVAAYTPLRLIPRAGRGRFVSAALSASRFAASERRIHDALFGPWRYERVNNLRWDPGAPASLRAYSAQAPTHFGPLGVPGAIALALAALCYFPLIVGADGRAACRGFASADARVMRWPLWTQSLDEPATRTTLSIPAIHAERPDAHLLARHGIFARVSARREQFGRDDQLLSWGEVELIDSEFPVNPQGRARLS